MLAKLRTQKYKSEDRNEVSFWLQKQQQRRKAENRVGQRRRGKGEEKDSLVSSNEKFAKRNREKEKKGYFTVA